MTLVLKKGCKAYYDTFSGPVPCAVLSISKPAKEPMFDLRSGLARASWTVKFVLTGTVGAYKKDEVLEASAIDVFPRTALVRMGFSSVIALYEVEADETI